MTDRIFEIKERLRELSDSEESINLKLKDFTREIEDKELFISNELRKNDEMFESSNNDPKLAAILEEKNSILHDMKNDCFDKFEEVKAEYRKVIDSLKEERDLLRSDLADIEEERDNNE